MNRRLESSAPRVRAQLIGLTSSFLLLGFPPGGANAQCPSPNPPSVVVEDVVSLGSDAAVGIRSCGEFIIAYERDLPEGTPGQIRTDIFVQRYYADGTPLSSPVKVSNDDAVHFRFRHQDASIAMSQTGLVKVGWIGTPPPAFPACFIACPPKMIQVDFHFDTLPFEIGSYSAADDDREPSVGVSDNGGAVVWSNDISPPIGNYPDGIVYEVDGSAITQIIGCPSSFCPDRIEQWDPCMALRSLDSAYVVVWADSEDDSFQFPTFDIKLQLYDANGIEIGNRVTINESIATLPTSEESPAVALDDLGNLVVVWAGQSSEGCSPVKPRVWARRLSWDGVGTPSFASPQFMVDSDSMVRPLPIAHMNPTVALSSSTDPALEGSFIIAWNADVIDNPSIKEVRAQYFSADGTPTKQEFRLNVDQTDTGLDVSYRMLADSAKHTLVYGDDGQVVATWTTFSGTDGSGAFIPVDTYVTILPPGYADSLLEHVGGTILYVDADSTAGSPNGQDWPSAFPKLQEAVSSAVTTAACQSVEIRVAEGTYMPDGGYIGDTTIFQGSGDRATSFQLLNNVRIRGGYKGISETEVPDPKVNVTILSGDLQNNDGTVGNGDNSYHVVTGSGTDATAVIEGFTITAGNADGPAQADQVGGGMYNVGGSPTVYQCTFQANTAAGDGGGGMYNANNNSPSVTSCRFIDNTITGINALGGGMLNSNGSAPSVINCIFKDNSTSPTGSGGGMANSSSMPTLTNCTFNGNTAGDKGGGIMNSSASIQTVANCILWGNTDGDQSGTTETAQIHDEAGTVSTVTFSCIEGSSPGLGEFNIACDPSFTATLHLQTGSPCIDIGNSCDVPVNIETDLDGNSRILDGGGNTGQCPVESGTLLCTLLPRVDMGAFEFDPTPAALISHGSEKVHGSAGAFLIESGSVECRDIPGNLTLVYVFDQPVYSDDGDAFVAGDFMLTNGSFVSVAQSFDLMTLTITCTNVLDAQCFGIVFTVENAVAVEASYDHAWPILRGDVDGDGLVDVVDLMAVSDQSGNPIDASNFRSDIDWDGLIEGSSATPVGDDWAIVNSAQGNGLMPCSPVQESASSRKSHGSRDYDIPSGGIEPRTGDLLIVFEFDRLVRSLDDDPLAPSDFTISSGTVAWVSAGWDWSTVEVTILGASDKETFTISFDAEDKDNFPIYTEGCWSMLVGDVDGDGSTSSVDTSAIAGANRAPITSSNFKYDIDANGQITGAAPDTTDYDLANANTGQSVTTCP